MIPAVVFRWLIFLAWPVLVCATNLVQASTLPDHHALVEATKGEIPLDPNFARWMAKHARQLTFGKGKEQDFLAQLKQEDDVTQQFAYLYYGRSQLSRAEALPLAKALVASLVQYQSQNDKEHELAPYIYELVHRTTNAASLGQVDVVAALANERGPISCPNFRYIHERITDATFVKQSPEEVNRLLLRLQTSHSSNSLRETLQVFATMVPENKRAYYRDALAPLTVRIPRFTTYFPWLLPPGAPAKAQAAADRGNGRLLAVQQKARKRLCAGAHKDLAALLQQKPLVVSFDPAVKTLRRIGDCFRAQGAAHRLNAWKEMVAPMDEAFGLKAWAYLKLEIARFAWTADDFAESQAVLDEVVQKTAQGIDAGSHAHALFLWARINENEGKYDEAIMRYRSFIKLYPQHENYFVAKTAIVLIYAGQDKWAQTLEMAKSIIVDEGELAYDERDVSTLGFALFWGGRAALELGYRDEGLAYWQRVASEFFSTYYGALGHYMLERVSGKRYMLQPAKTQGFKTQNLVGAFKGHEDHERFERVLTLLRLGLQDEARCESREMDIASLNPPQQLGVALVQHIVGDWLAAIRTFSNMPRSYRRTLAPGFERILFPKKYDKEVDDYARRLAIDPDLIFSLIRQESVFNPRAQSGAGAMGLMQLLANTARIEAKRLAKDYVTAPEKQALIKKSQLPVNLFETDTNLILGIHYLSGLMERFDSTILSLSAYNAGPSVTQRWLKKYPADDPLYFIELIPYRETRDYVKLILRNYFYYNRWYDHSDAELPYLHGLSQFATAPKSTTAPSVPM